jgi:hypothetical protein
MAEAWMQTDNSSPELKAALRERFLRTIEDPHVLDLFCGAGEMYKRVYAGKVAEYVGVDRAKVHDAALCVRTDNRRYIATHDISRFNVLDLDDYGCPWLLLFAATAKVAAGRLLVFVTDGLPLHMRVESAVTHIISATERLPKHFAIPGAARFYVPMFLTMLRELERRNGLTVSSACYCPNQRRTVYYWALAIDKHEPQGKC